MNFITTQVLINSLGVNVNKATGIALSAGLNWAIKEGVGQIASIIFTTKYTQKVERLAKTWRVLSIGLACTSLMVESTSLLYPKYFLLIATSANISK
jgi:hypothetical protein